MPDRPEDVKYFPVLLFIFDVCLVLKLVDSHFSINPYEGSAVATKNRCVMTRV